MRWLFLFLLLFNIAYLAWELNREQPQQATMNTLPPGVERIALLQELKTEATPNQADFEATEKKEERQVIGKPGADAEPAKPVEPDKTKPSQPELASTGGSADDVAEAQATSVPEKAPAGDLCYTLGPFSEMKTLRLVTREIKDYVVEASFRSREEQEQSMFRVYLKPVGSKQEARELTKELVSKNIRDYFIITDGPNKNGISLGYFSSKRRAYRHAERVRKLGFDAIAEPVFRTYTIYWLDYRIKAGNEIPQQIFDEHLENSAQRLSRSCS
jgi:hypothetical protein